MKRSLQEYVELVVFGLIALLVGTGLLWVGGWVLSLLGIVLKGLAGLLWMLLRFVVPVAIAAGLVYFLVKAAQGRQRSGTGSDSSTTPVPAAGATSYTPPTPGTTPPTAAPVNSSVSPATDLVSEFDAGDAPVTDSATDAAVDEAVDEPIASRTVDEAADEPIAGATVDDAVDGTDTAEGIEGDENDRV